VKIVWTRRAGEYLDREKASIAERDPAAARRTAARILTAIDRLGRHPNLGRPGRVPGTRELVVPRTPYIVPYRVKGDTVQILRIFHTSRRWPGDFEA
jgi:plasmid stabilization system protein ParE